jgi:hypothetical protein
MWNRHPLFLSQKTNPNLDKKGKEEIQRTRISPQKIVLEKMDPLKILNHFPTLSPQTYQDSMEAQLMNL